MSATTPCYRHRRATWIVSCPDCTAWHLAAAITRRDAAASATAGSLQVLPRPRAAELPQQALLPAA